MKKRILTSALVSAALIAVPAERATADAGDFIAGAIIGGIVGANVKKKKRTGTTRRTVSRPRLPATQEGRLTQTSLNYFGFNAGTVDGQLGRKSRAAISNYQAHMGYPVTGTLSDYGRNFLFTSYQRAQAGGATTLQQIAQNPQGARGLLHVYRDQAAGIQTAAVPNTAVVAPVPAPAPAAPQPVAVAPAPVAPAPAAPLPTLAPATTGTTSLAALPNFSSNTASVSLASHCNGVALLTNSNGGFTTVSNMTDPVFLLGEQFCLARTYAIAKGEEMTAKLGNVTPAQVTQQCEAFGPAMTEQLTLLATQPMDTVVQSTSGFVLSTGMNPSDLRSTAQICLSSGYRTDNMDVAIGSALLLVTLGETPYGELVGHHLSQGFGVANRPDLAQGWYTQATDAILAGTPAVFAPGQPERTDLVKQASIALTGGGAIGTQPQPVATLPSFGSTDQ